MEAEDLIDLPAATSDFGSGSGEKRRCNSDCDTSEPVFQPSNSDVREDKMDGESLVYNEGDVRNQDSQVIQGININNGSDDNLSITHVSISMTETVTVAEKLDSFSSRVENTRLTAQDDSLIGNCKMGDKPKSGVKRARTTYDEQKPSVHVIYDSLTRESKRKLEELLQQWSDWHARHCSSTHDENEVLESGEYTYYPPLHVLDKPSAVSFWMDNQRRERHNKELILDSASVPLYDRGYAFGLTSVDGSNNVEGGLENASRCFNCGSYNHALKECPKPRNNAAVNNARKQRNSKRNQNSGARNPARYYQNSSGGKYEGLRPGVLNAETRKLLNLGELDPPPWLKRMREIGYPPGYLDPVDEDQPSGITIFGDEDNKEEKEDGEILETQYPELQRKMSVEFPGINAPIPENADESRWTAGALSSDPYRNRSHRHHNYSLDPSSRGHYREQRWSHEFRDDGPPGCDPGVMHSSSYPPRHGGFDSTYNSQSRSPSLGRSVSDRGRWSPSEHEGSASHGAYSSSSYRSSNRRPSTSASFDKFDDGSRNDFTPDYSSHSKDKRDSHHYHSRR